MTTRLGTPAEFADSNKCICCKRSKSGGSFFEVRPNYLTFYYFRHGDWNADVDVFREASRQGCQRCAVAFDMVMTWMRNNPRSEWRNISVWNESVSGSTVADVRVCLSESHQARRHHEKNVKLELLSANRRCPK